MAGMALPAASAMADVPASWVQVAKGTYPSGKLTAPSTITVYKDEGFETSCTQTGTGASLLLFNEGTQSGFLPLGTLSFSCTGGKTFSMGFGMNSATYGTEYTIQGSTGTASFGSPWGTYLGSGETFSAPFTNGAEKTLSTITVSKLLVGTTKEGLNKITVSGAFSPALESSGLLTLTH